MPGVREIWLSSAVTSACSYKEEVVPQVLLIQTNRTFGTKSVNECQKLEGYSRSRLLSNSVINQFYRVHHVPPCLS